MRIAVSSDPAEPVARSLAHPVRARGHRTPPRVALPDDPGAAVRPPGGRAAARPPLRGLPAARPAAPGRAGAAYPGETERTAR